MYCEYCGSEISDNSKFCNNCGMELKSDEVCPICSSTDIDLRNHKCRSCGYDVGQSVNEYARTHHDTNDEQETNKVSPFGIVSFILSLILAVICPAGFIPSTRMMILIAIPSVVFGIVGVCDNKHKKHGLAIAGLVICIIAILTGGFFRIGR